MQWPLKEIDPELVAGHGWPVGAYWYGRSLGPEHGVRPLSPEYLGTHAAHRKPITVALPMKNGAGEIYTWPFCIDECASNSDHGWTVTGELPNITVTPSIHGIGAYHGFITAGVLTDGLL